MDSIEDLINNHNESNFLDFKKENYTKEKKHELLKDLIAFANADYSGDRYIIIGVNEKAHPRELFDIPIAEEAHLQQFVSSNINPELQVRNYPYPYKGKNLSIIEIVNPVDQPYELKKNYACKTEKGEKIWDEGTMFIRIGCHTKAMSRKYLDKIYTKKTETIDEFAGKVEIYFADATKVLNLTTTENIILPSENEVASLKRAIKDKTKLLDTNPYLYTQSVWQGTYSGQSNSNLTIPMLETRLGNVSVVYRPVDYYKLAEETSHKIQFMIKNNGIKPLTDVVFKVEIQEHDGLHIPERIAKRHVPYSTYAAPDFDTQEERDYPSVTTRDDITTIESSIGQVMHKLDKDLLLVPFRIYFDSKLKGETIDLKCILHASNMSNPIIRNLHIKII